MTTPTPARGVASILCAFVLIAAGAGASSAAVLSKPDQKCRSKIAKSFSKALLTGDKVSIGCHKQNYESGLVDCNDLSTSQADSRAQFERSTIKLQDSIAKSCENASNVVLSRFHTCPEPCATSTGVSQPLANFTQVGLCLSCLAGDIIGRRNELMLGLPGPLPGSPEVDCHSSIARGYSKRLKSILKKRQKCQKAQDKLGNIELAPCDTSALDGLVANVTAGAQAAVTKGCSTADLAQVDSCANTSVPDLNACLLALDDPHGAEAFESGYELATLCGNLAIDPGEDCDSGGVDTLACDYDCTDRVCGDGYANQADPAELCDGGQCCTETCEYEPLGTPCNDSNICTSPDTCNGAGACGGDPRPAEPVDCTEAMNGGSTLILKNKGTKGDRLTWKWGRNPPALTLADLGDPVANGYTLCVYSDAENLADPGLFRTIRLPVNPGSRWSNFKDKKFKYKDRTLTPHGASSALLKPGGPRKAKIKVKAKGTNLHFSNLNLVEPYVKVQLRNSAECFEAVFLGPVTDPKFKQKSTEQP